MKLATFTHAGATGVGVVVGEEIIALAAAAPALPHELTALLAAGPDALAAAAQAAEHAAKRHALADVRLEPPLLRPPKILAIGLNYQEHIQESGLAASEVPTVFNKQSTAVTGPYDPIHLPRVSRAVDYEGELGFVIGRRCRHVPKDRAFEMIAGYLVVNDVSVRDWQLRTPTMTMGKSFDTHCPLGPWITTSDSVADPHSLRIRTWVNGELRQDSNTGKLIHGCDDLVAHLSTAFTLEPGDVIVTGTPAGVGFAMKPPRYLLAGDEVHVEIEGLGRIENPVIEEPEDTAEI